METTAPRVHIAFLISTFFITQPGYTSNERRAYSPDESPHDFAFSVHLIVYELILHNTLSSRHY